MARRGARAELLPVPYFHVVFTLAGQDSPPIAYQNKAVVYDLLVQGIIRGAVLTIAADPETPRRPHRPSPPCSTPGARP